MIKAVLLDFGGVYIESPFAALADVAAEMGVDYERLSQITFGDYHADNDHAWHQLERGEISLEQAREAILRLGAQQQLETDIYQMFARFAGMERMMRGPLLDKTLEWRERGLKLGMITNNIREFTGWRELFPFALDEVFEYVADSCYLGLRKPNPEIFHHTLNALGLKPGEALFLDDYPSNVAAAEACGIQSFLVQGPIEDSIRWVEEQLG